MTNTALKRQVSGNDNSSFMLEEDSYFSDH